MENPKTIKPQTFNWRTHARVEKGHHTAVACVGTIIRGLACPELGRHLNRQAQCILTYLGKTTDYHISLQWISRLGDFELATWPPKIKTLCPASLEITCFHWIWWKQNPEPAIRKHPQSMSFFPPLSPFWTFLLRAQIAWRELLSRHEAQLAALGMMGDSLRLPQLYV